MLRFSCMPIQYFLSLERNVYKNKMTEITVRIDMEELRNIYWGNGYQRYFFGPTTKKESAWLIVAVLVYPFFAWYSIRLEDYIWFVSGTVFFTLLVYRFIDVARPIIAWKKSVTDFLTDAEKTTTLKIMYTDEFIIHQQDEITIKLNWSMITKATITDRFISFEKSPDTFLIPKKSITEDEFQALDVILMAKVQHVERRTV